MLAAGPAAVHWVYGPEYHEAGWMLQFLAVGGWFQMLEVTAGVSLLALGKARSLLVSVLSRLVGLMLFAPLGWWVGGMLGPAGVREPGGPPVYWEGSFVGLLVGFIAADALRYLMVVWLAHLEGMSAWKYDLGLSALIVGYSLGGYAIGQALTGLLLGGEPRSAWLTALVEFLCIGTVVVLAWGATVALARATGRFRLRPHPE
jgi:O-antigen/teichoic acid export membrane protein